MSRLLIVHMLAERERAVHEGGDPVRATWHDAAPGEFRTRLGQTAAPGPGSGSTSPPCIGSPQWAQRSSGWLISPHA